MATMTIAQALVSTNSRISIADTAADIAAVLPDPSLLARVSSFTLDADSVATVAQAEALLTLGSLFRPGRYSYTIADSVAALSDPAAAAALTLASGITVVDTAANLLAGASSDTVLHANTTVLSSSATVSAPQLLMLEALPDFTVAPNQTITVADTLETLAALAIPIAAAAAELPIAIQPTNSNVTLTADAAAALTSLPGLRLSSYDVSVADTGDAITADASQLFGQGLTAITVTSGVFSGTPSQMADPTLQYAAPSTTSSTSGGVTNGDEILAGGAQITTNTTLSTTQLLGDTLQLGFSVANGVILTVQDTAENLIANAAVVETYATAIVVTDSPTLTAAQAEVLAGVQTAVGAGHFSLGSNTITVSDNPAALTNPANAAGIALAAGITLPSDSVANAAEALILAAYRGFFTTGGYNLVVIDTASALVALTGDIARAVNVWSGQVILSADATLSVASVEILQNLDGFGPGARQLTISDTVANLLSPDAAAALAIATATELSAPAANQTVATATALTALHGFTADSFGLTVSDTPANLAAMSAATAAFVTSESFATRTVGNAADYTISVAQLTALQALSGLNVRQFAGSFTIADTADTLTTLGPQLGNITIGSLLSKATFALSANATTTATEAGNLANFPGFSTGGHSLAILDQPGALLSPGAIGGIALATSVGISGPAIVSAATAASLAALHNYLVDNFPLTIRDTAAALAAATQPALAIASAIQVSSNTQQGGFTISVSQFNTMTGLANLSFAGFSGTITVLDSATALVGLANSITTAGTGSVLKIASGAIVEQLSGNGTVNAAGLLALATLPPLSLNSHTLTVQDTPTALLAAFPGPVPLASAVMLTTNLSPWSVSASSAAALATMPGFSVGSAGMAVLDTTTNLLNTSYAAGIADAVSATLSGNATVTAANATYLYNLGNFSTGTASLTIQDGAGKLAALGAGAAALASSILQQGSGLVSVAQFTALRSLSHFSTNSNLLIVADTATNLLTLASTNTSLATALVLDANATSLTAAQAETLATLPNFTAGTAQLGIVDSGADLLHITGLGSLPDDWAGELAATSVTLSGNATMTASQADEMALLGTKFSRGGFTLTVADTAANLVLAANAAGVALGTTVTLIGNESAVSAATATALAGVAHFSKGVYTVTISDTSADLLDPAYAAGVSLADHVKLSTAAALTVANAAALIGLANYQAGATLTIADTLPNLLTLASTTLAHNNSTLQSTAIGLSAATTATVAQLAALAALPEYSGFSRNGFALVVADTGAAIAGYTHDVVAVPTGYTMIGAATLTASQAGVLASDSINLNGNTLTVADTPTALLAGGNASGVALATALTLSAAATASATQATGLFSNVKFSTGGYALTVSDSVSALLGLSNTVTTAASSLALSATQSVSATQLANLATLGSKFSLAGHTLTVSDTATALAALSLPALALATAETLSASTTVGAQVAAELAALPNFSKGSFVLTVSDTATNLLDPAYTAGLVLSGHATLSTSITVPAIEAAALALLPGFALGSTVTLAVQDSVANLIGMSAGAKAAATSELLPAGAVTVTAAQGSALDLLPHFSTSGATITVNDTVAFLNTYTAWSGIDASYIVTDTAANIAAATPSTLISNAASVVLAGGADIAAATAATLGGISTFSRGGWLLTVTDTPAAIATNATAILAVASSARIDASTPISASQAEALVPLNTASKLGYSNGVTLSVQDSYTNLTNVAYAGGLALATTVTVYDTLANVLTASAYNWGIITPNYVLSGGGGITGAQATTLAALGARFALNGQAVVVTDTAHNVVTAAAALDALNITAQVTDTTAHIVGNVAGLIARGDRLTLVTLTDSTAITAAQADAMHNLAAVLAGDMLTVSDTAAVISFNVTNLLEFGSQLGSVYVTDTAANVNAVTSGANAIQGLGALLHITLTDTNPVLASIAAGLVPVVSYLAGGTSLAVTDTGAHIATYSSALTTLIGSLGTVTLSDGTTVNASVATGVAPIATHLGLGVKLTVSDTAAALVAATTALETLIGDTRILSIVASNDLAANIVTNATALEALGATATVLDSATNVMTALDSLEPLANTLVTAIAFTDLSAPVLTMSVNTLATDSAAIGLITGSFGISVHDLAANIQADLASVSSSLVANLSVVSSVVATDNGGISLTESRAVATGVDSGVASVMARFTGGAFTVTGVLVAQVGTVAGLYVVPASMTVSDTASNIQTDLTSGSSTLIAHRALISGITLTSGNTITLTEAQATTAGVATLMNETTGLQHFNVTGVTIAQVATVAALGVAGTAMAVTPTAADYLNDLTGGASVLEQYHARIGSVVFSDSVNPNLTLTIAQITAADTILGLTGPHDTLTVADSATHVQNDLALGATSVILTHTILGITLTSGNTITLTEAQVVYAGVAAALQTLSDPYNLVVTGATIGQIATIEALSLGSATITVDVLASGAAVQSDLTGGASVLTAQAAHIGSITLSDLSAPTITLNVAQLTTDATVLGLIGSPYNLAVSDTASAVQTDLALGATSKILAHGNLSTITLPASSTITLTESQAVFTGVAGALNTATGLTAVDVTGVTVAQVATVAALGINNVAMAVSDLASAVQGDLTGGSSVLEANESSIASITLTDGGTPTITLSIAQVTAGAEVLGLIGSTYHLAIGDTAANVQADLILGASSVILGHTISLITLTSGHTISLTESQAVYSGVAAALLLTTGLTSFVVTGATIGQIGTVLGLGITGTTIGVSASAAAVQSDLTGGSSVLTANVAALQGITLTDLSRPTITLSVTQLGTDATVLGKIGSPYYIAVSDTAAHVQSDLALGGTSNILAQGANLSGITLTTGTTITLTEGQAVFTGVSTALLATTGLTSFVVTGVAVNQIATVLNLTITNTVLHVSDTAAHVQSDLTGGSSVLEADHASISVIALTGGTTLTLSIAQITSASSVLSLISSYSLAVSDTASNVQSDLALGGSSQIVSHHTHVTSVTLTSGSTITLTESQATASFVGGALGLTSGLTSFVVTGAAINQITTVLGLGVSNTTVDVSTTGALVQGDLTGAGVLVANEAHIGSITLTDVSTPTIALSVTQLESSTTVLGLIGSSYDLAISGAAQDVQNDLTGGTPALEAFASHITGITLTDGGTPTITMTVPQLVAAASVIPLLGPSYVLAVSGTAAQVQADLTSASPVLVANYGTESSINLTDLSTPTITLNVAQLGVAAALLVEITATAGSFNLAFNDTAAHVQTDLALGATSNILQAIVAGSTHYIVTGVTIPASSTITLTEAEAVYSGVAAVLQETTGLSHFIVTGVTQAQISDVSALGVTGTSVNLSTSAAAVQSDLTGAQVLLTDLSILSGITLTDMTTQTIALNVTQLTNNASVLALIDSAYHLSITDTANAVQTDLALGATSAILGNSHINAITLSPSGTITLTEAQAVYAGVAAALNETTALSSFVVTGVAVSQVAAVAGLTVANTTIDVSSSALLVQQDLNGATPVLVANVAKLGTITLTDGGTPTLDLSVLQLEAATGVLALIGSAFGLALNGSASQIATDLANEATSAILEYASDVTGGITLLGATTITLTESVAVYSGVAAALGLMGNLTGLTVTGVLINQITTVLGLGVTPTTVNVSASAASVQSDLTGGASVLTANVSHIGSIALSDGSTPTIALNVTQTGADTAVLALISSTYHLNIGDTATAVQNDLASGGSSIILAAAHLTGVNITGSNTITLTEAQAVFAGVAAVLQETSGLIHFVVTGVAINQIATVLALAVNGTTIHVSTLAQTLQTDLTGGSSVVLADIAHIGTITLTDGTEPTITLTVAELAADASVLAAIGSSFHIAISDTATNVQNDLALGATSTILGNLSSITGITVPASSTITLTSAQVQYTGVDDSGTSALALTSGLTSLVVTQTLVADIGTVLGLTVPATAIQVKDSDANITGDIGGAGTIASNLSVITKVTTNETTLGTTDSTTIYTAVGSKFDETALTISDTASALLSAHTAHAALLSAALHLTLSANASGVSAANATILAGLSNFSLNSHALAVADSYSQLLLGGNATGIALATTVQLNAIATVTAQVATQIAALHNFTAGPAITVQDSVTNLVNASYATSLAAATTVELAANDTASASQLATLAGITGYTDGAFSLTLATNISGLLGLNQTQLGFATTTAITDTTNNFNLHVTAIQAALPAHSHVFSITLSDPVTDEIFLTAANYTAAAATYAAITNANVIAVGDGAAALAAIAGQLAANNAVGQVTVNDSAANILSNLTTLQSIGSKFTSAMITDTSVNAAEVASLLAITNLSAPGLTISDTGAQIAAAIQANGADLTFMNAHNVTLSGDSVIAAADAVTLETLTSFSKAGYHLYVWDTASHLTDSIDGYLAAVQNGIISGVYLKATGNTATISASLASTLLSISAFNRNDPPSPAGDGLANTLIVSDTAAHIDAVFTNLNAHKSALSSIVVSATATVTDAVFGELLTLGATMAGGKTLTVRDTAANIIASAAAQMSGSPSITPTAWQINASASVAPSGAILLAGLTGFSIGAFTLTLNASATITVANANSLGVLSTSLALGGNHLFVNGTVATMTAGPGLTSNAKLIVTPNITDSFSNIATLTTGSGLLGGTITINDSEAVTTTQASNFLALLGGSGIPVANVSFGSNVESITDTLSNITTLTASAGWTGNTSVHSDFSLVVADTVSVLTNASNTTTLAGMHATTFSSNQSMLAATAETLFALENTIHFSKGSTTLTIQDIAANLLNPANSDGVALADALNLSTDGTVAAADAETLLTNSHFSVNGHTLTVSDSSANLLDGILSGDITGSGSNEAHVVVELQATEVLDAGTATALVALPGFTDPNHDLSIADGSSYLLAASAHTAETDATSVTLAGDETVSLATAKALSLLPNFSLQSNHLLLASNDFADAATLNAVASFGSGFNHNTFTVTMTQDDLTLTPTQYTALQSDDVVLNGHALSAMPVSITVSSNAGTAHVAGTGIAGATVNVYSSSGSSLSSTSGVAASFTANASEGSIGNGMVVTEVVGGSAATSESAPIIALEATVLTNAATADSATFLGTGAVQIGGGQYANLYTTATAPTNPANPILVYDPTAHTLSLDITGHAATLLVTLGTATHPTALTAAEIFVQHFS